MVNEASIMQQMVGVQHHEAGVDKYWIECTDADKFEDWLEGQEHTCITKLQTHDFLRKA